VFLYGVSRFLFVALAMAVILSLFASYFVAMTVVPLFCAKLIKRHQADEEVGEGSVGARFGGVAHKFNFYFEKMLKKYDRTLATTLLKPVASVAGLAGVALLCLSLYPLLGVSFFPRTDPGQFVINMKAPSGTRVELTENYVKQIEAIIRQIVPASDLQIIVSNIGITTDFSAIYTTNSSPNTAFVQVSLKKGHKIGSYEYMKRVRERLGRELRSLTSACPRPSMYRSAATTSPRSMRLPRKSRVRCASSKTSATS
jgi:HAE1 family hydrophobic/amphiphilic exporter-1